MVDRLRSWRLERNGNTSSAAVCSEFARYTQDSGHTTAAHHNPAWQLVLSWDGPLLVTDHRGRVTTAFGIVIAPRIRRMVHCPAGFTSLWVDPHRIDTAMQACVHAMEHAQVRRLQTAARGELDPLRLRGALREVLGDAPPVDPRLRQVLDLLDSDADINELAGVVGISARRLRQLSVQQLGGSLTMLRRWHRLREAVLQIPFHPAADIAARTGFADQAHLVRTAVALGGRTPGSLRALRS
ncbi:AraC family transcriptional regulator [Streptantibioticus ferralitis]|uniref:Helix-turn-helix domain-containing protein n=1 Tax=Streptantibioticus ferralitis TaxID=236510 RepID=A0ABT5Z179_9ACTN|nr:helix-turn-helix domain-containing protein [Streptantibioticus ferralitis]MDF2257533.1 helix-turn-helix domain-containing protein [Streptantibioticus ferralitis]